VQSVAQLRELVHTREKQIALLIQRGDNRLFVAVSGASTQGATAAWPLNQSRRQARFFSPIAFRWPQSAARSNARWTAALVLLPLLHRNAGCAVANRRWRYWAYSLYRPPLIFESCRTLVLDVFHNEKRMLHSAMLRRRSAIHTPRT
jgi:hypothetical protein